MCMKDYSSKTNDCFGAADILLPENCELQRWAVIACDQFTSQPAYWQQVDALTEGVPSAEHLILPECRLSGSTEETIARIHETMRKYIREDLLRAYPDSFLYIERTLHNGQVRRGLIGMVDLEQYDYSGEVDAAVRATEQTVSERIPPRMAVRRGAALELPHVLLLCDDERQEVIETLTRRKEQLKKLYDFDLMLGGGHLAGWLVDGEEKQALEARIAAYEHRERKKHPDARLLYAVGDGNHSLATAKACFEELKAQHPDQDFSRHPARYALCELNNIHDPSQVFEPIHRIVKHCDTEKLLRDLSERFDTAEGTPVPWVSGGKNGMLRIPEEGDLLPLALLQRELDRWLTENDGELDYIHGDAALDALEHEQGSVGFRLPAIDKESLFPGILSGGVLPRKTFSMGEAEEKRYYLEARKILP